MVDEMKTKLHEEAGITSDSLSNAQELVRAHGVPVRLEFNANTRRGDYFVNAVFPNGYNFVFTGFAWGYGGTGPHGLDEFLDLLGVTELESTNIPVHEGYTNFTFDVTVPK